MASRRERCVPCQKTAGRSAWTTSDSGNKKARPHDKLDVRTDHETQDQVKVPVKKRGFLGIKIIVMETHTIEVDGETYMKQN